MFARVEIHVDTAQADRVDVPVELLDLGDRNVELAVGADARDIEVFTHEIDVRAVIARRRTERNGNDFFHLGTPGSSHNRFSVASETKATASTAANERPVAR